MYQGEIYELPSFYHSDLSIKANFKVSNGVIVNSSEIRAADLSTLDLDLMIEKGEEKFGKIPEEERPMVEQVFDIIRNIKFESTFDTNFRKFGETVITIPETLQEIVYYET